MEKNMHKSFYEKLIEVIDKESVFIDEPMEKHTTFRVGGKVDYFVQAKSDVDVKSVVGLCRSEKMPCCVIGNGSNLLVGDKGYRGVIIQIWKAMSNISVEDNMIYAQGGALLSKIGNIALEAGLTGFEFAAGIPGTVGGAVVMNAGAYGGEMKDVLKEVTVLDEEGNIFTLEKEALELGYRTSVVAKKGYVVLSVVIELQKGDKEKIRERMNELREQRTTKQPLEYPSAGSTFKRPEGYFAGKLIQDAGLRGFQVGGAKVSEKHCGFVINADHATAADIVELIEQVQDKVRQQFGVELEMEVKKLGEF